MSSRSAVSRITSKGQVTVPEVIRRHIRLQAGDRIEWDVADDGTVEIRKVGESLEDLTRILPRPKRSRTIEQMDRDVGAHLEHKHGVRR
jgi:antitoxin PrlF